MNGYALTENAPMLALATRLGFALTDDRDPDLVRLEKPLTPRRRANWIATRMRRLVRQRPLVPAALAVAAQAAR
jgi:hypothetical protein